MIQLCQQNVRGSLCITEEVLPGQPLAFHNRRGLAAVNTDHLAAMREGWDKPQCGCSGVCKLQKQLQHPPKSEILARREEFSQYGAPDIFEQLNHTSCAQLPDTISPKEKFWLFMLLWLGFLSFWSLTEQIQGVYCKNWSWLGSPSWPGSPGFGDWAHEELTTTLNQALQTKPRGRVSGAEGGSLLLPPLELIDIQSNHK